MSSTEPVARILDIQQNTAIRYKHKKYTGTSSKFNNIEAVLLSEDDLDFLVLEMLVFRPTCLVGRFMRMKAYSNMPLYVGDIVYNGTGIVSLIEFFIGGRVGINSSSSVVIVAERLVKNFHKSPLRTVLQNSSIWIKDECKNLKHPLEIQTNGGVFGIKG